MDELFGRKPKSDTPIQAEKEPVKVITDINDSLLAQEIYPLAKTNKDINLDRFLKMAALYEACAVNNAKYNYFSEYELKDKHSEYTLLEWKKFLSLACVQNFINARKLHQLGEMISNLYAELDRQKSGDNGISPQLVNSINKAIEGLQKLMSVTDTKPVFITTYLGEKNYNSIMANKVYKTNVMNIETDNSLLGEE